MQTAKTSKLPLFFTQVIGSLPRPLLVRDLLSRRAEMDPIQHRALMDEMVTFAVRLQEQAGLDVVSDGEWRRIQYVNEFLDRIGGFARVWKYEHQGETKYTRAVVKRVDAHGPVFVEDARFLKQNTDRCTKFALPSPFLIAIRYWNAEHSKDAYPTPDHLMMHMAEILSREAKGLVEAGIDIVQLDDPALTYFCDRSLMAGESSHDARLRREWDVDKQFPRAVEAINMVVDGLKAQVHLHCCHSVYKRQSDVVGDYKPILPRLADAHIDRVNIEFAYHGTGDVTDLSYLPANLNVGMGVVDVRGETLQSTEDMAAIGEAGSKLIDASRIALNPDCGFAPDAGEPPTIDEAYEKLKRLAQAATVLRASRA